MLRLTTDKEIEKFNLKVKYLKDEISELKAENYQLKDVITGAYNRLNNYTITILNDYRKVIKEVKELLEPNIEKKLSDEIFEHYKSSNN